MLTIEKPPLKTFRIDFKFKKPKKISFDMMSKVEELLKKDYPIAPSLDIIEYPYDVKIKARIPIQIGPISFLNKEKNVQIQFFSDGLIFIFTEYTHWNDIKGEIIDLVLNSCKILKIDKIEQFRMEYLDEFTFPKKNFDLSNYFNLSINKPEKWSIDFKDFHTGIKINTLENDKFIIRLRGIPIKESESFLFRLESVYLKQKEFSIDEEQILIDELNYVHDTIIDYFFNIMSENLRQILGVKKND